MRYLHSMVRVRDLDASLKFYHEVLGLKISSHYGDHWASVEAGIVHDWAASEVGEASCAWNAWGDDDRVGYRRVD